MGKEKLEDYGAKASLAKAQGTIRSGSWIGGGQAGKNAERRNRDGGVGVWKPMEVGMGRRPAFL